MTVRSWPQRQRVWTNLFRERFDLVLLAVIVLFGLAVRLYDLGRLPDTLLADEADNAQAAIRILRGVNPINGFFGFDWTQQPAYSVYLLAGFLKLFGVSIMAIRLPSAVLSTLSLIPFYLLLERQFSKATSLLATFLLATNVWYLNFSRSGWNCGHTCFYMLMALLFLTMALDRVADSRGGRRRPWIFFGLTGFFCALGLYSYPNGRAITLGVIVFGPFALRFYRRHWKTLLKGYLLVAAVTVLLFLPEAVYIARNFELFNGRLHTVTLTNKPDYRESPAAALWAQVKRNVRGPWDGSVNNTWQYTPGGEPQLDRPTGWLTLAGLLLSLALPALRRRPETWLWWCALLAAWAPTQLLTVGTPNGARGVIYVPALLYFAAAGLDSVLSLARREWGRRLAVAVAAPLVLFFGLSNVGHYWSWQTNPRTRQSRWVYITASEFPEWLAWVTDVADWKGGVTNLGQWVDSHPGQDPSVPVPQGLARAPTPSP